MKKKVVFQNVLCKITWQQAIEKAYKLAGLQVEYVNFFKEIGGVGEIPGQWVLPMVKGITCNNLRLAFKKEGVSIYQWWDDLDKEVPYHDRDANKQGSYCISVKANVEADEEHKSKFVHQLKKDKHEGITLPERLFLELVYFLMTGKHLDNENVTLCFGSRDIYTRVSVPIVYWEPAYDEVYVFRHSLRKCHDSLRSRQVFFYNLSS